MRKRKAEGKWGREKGRVKRRKKGRRKGREREGGRKIA